MPYHIYVPRFAILYYGVARYPVPDNVEMGNDHGNCWLLRHCDSWEVSKKNIYSAKRWDFLSVQATLPRCVKRVSRAPLEKPMWTIAYENSFLHSLVELDITCESSSFTLRFLVNSGWSLCHKSKLRQVWNVQRSFLCTEQHRGSLAKPPVTKLWSNLDSNKKRVEPNYDLLIVFLTGINVGKNCPPIKIHLATVIAVSKMLFSANFWDKLFARLKRGNRSSWGGR